MKFNELWKDKGYNAQYQAGIDATIYGGAAQYGGVMIVYGKEEGVKKRDRLYSMRI